MGDRPTRARVKWKPPDDDSFKTNLDGAVFAKTNEASIGVVVRNEMGKVLEALSEKLALLASMELLETLAARRAALFVVELELHDSIFKGDSKVVM